MIKKERKKRKKKKRNEKEKMKANVPQGIKGLLGLMK